MTGPRSTLPPVQSEPWMATAACRGPAAVGVDFFPGQGGGNRPAITYLPAVKERGVDAALHVLIEDAG